MSAPPVADPIQSEQFHGKFLSQVSLMWQYLAIAAADHGDLDEAIRMLRRDLRARSPSHWSGALLAEYLVCQGKFDQAWRAYKEYLLSDRPFDAFEFKQGLNIVQDATGGVKDVVGGIDLSLEFKAFQEILQHLDEWNDQITKVGGREFKTLGSMSDTLSSTWFKQLDDLDKLRVLYYYRVTRPNEEEAESYSRTGELRETETLIQQKEEFTTTLHTSPQAEALWTRATLDRQINPPL